MKYDHVLIPTEKFTEILNSKRSKKDQLEAIVYLLLNDLQYRVAINNGAHVHLQQQPTHNYQQ
jgi:hypothetical protein